MNNKNLANAKKLKNDEFYTLLDDIQKELKNYTKHFENKIIYLNCDNPKFSNFWKYFEMNFEYLGLKKLIATYYNKKNNPTCWIISKNIDGNKLENFLIKGDGDFRSIECINFLKEADIIISNPPFSLFREYVSQIIKYKKKFIIIGNKNALTYQEIFSLIKNNEIWIGTTYPKNFIQTDYKTGIVSEIKVFAGWFTNLNHSKSQEKLILYNKFNENLYPKYDNYDAINVDKIKEIPDDYFGVIGVPITFIDKHNPDQFEIIGIMATTKITDNNFGYPYINGKKKYARILIKKKL